MKWTNRYNLPGPLVSALTHSEYESRGDISTTALIKPPRILQLEKRHLHEITKDVSENFWMMLGKANHVVAENSCTGDYKSEVQVMLEICGYNVSGTIDLVADNTIWDYKITSVWSAIKEPKPEWVQQLNIYRVLYAKLSIKRLAIIALLRDWQKSKSLQHDYPDVPVVVMDVPIWSNEEAETFIKNRVNLHKACVDLPSDQLPYCTSLERWERETTYAVMQKGRKTALRVLALQQEAEQWIKEKGKGDSIEIRLGESVRCESYCDVQPFCNQYKESIKKP